MLIALAVTFAVGVIVGLSITHHLITQERRTYVLGRLARLCKEDEPLALRRAA